jgi:type IV secretory pathway VirB2 component (pilin)
MKKLNKIVLILLSTMILLFAFSMVTLASATGMPWEGPLDMIVRSCTGPVAKAFAVLAVVLTGLGFAFGEGGSMFRKGCGIVFGISIAFAGTQFLLILFGSASGLPF